MKMPDALREICMHCDVVAHTLNDEGYTDCIANEIGRAALRRLFGETIGGDFLTPPEELALPPGWMGISLPVAPIDLVFELATHCRVVAFLNGGFVQVLANGDLVSVLANEAQLH
jgi:hypothetical protein